MLPALQRRLYVLPIALHALAILSRGHDGILGFLQDDAQYYFVTAEHLIRQGSSTFDGVTVTNGYHPLWFLLDAAVIALSGLDRQVYLTVFVLVSAGLAVIHGSLLRRLVVRMGAQALLADVSVLLVTTRSLGMAFSGMECALAMPINVALALATLKLLESAPSQGAPAGQKLRASQYVSLGLWAAAAALARLDAILLGMGAAVLVLWSHFDGLAASLRRALAFAAGLAPFLAYVAYNLASTGHALTASARAKTLAAAPAWNTNLFSTFSTGQRITFLLLPLLACALTLSGAVRLRAAARHLALLVFAFPVAYYATLIYQCHWQIWLWYLYPLPLAMGVGLVIIADVGAATLPPTLKNLGARVALPVAAAAAIMGSVRESRAVGSNEGVLRAAKALQEFARAHPGRYAMGDRAGLTAFLLPHPIVQLEGLVADDSMLQAIRHGDALEDTLRRYDVDYLIQALPTSTVVEGPCQNLEEPKALQAGEESPKLRGRFCDPLFRFDDRLDGYTTLVYPVASSTLAAPSTNADLP